MAKPRYLVCMPAATTEPRHVAEGSTIIKCDRCRQQIRIAPSGVEILTEFQIPALCTDCGIKPGKLPMPPTAKQIEEVKRHLKQ